MTWRQVHLLPSASSVGVRLPDSLVLSDELWGLIFYTRDLYAVDSQLHHK